MLYQELPRIESSPLDGWGALARARPDRAAAALTAAVILLLVGYPRLSPGLALTGGGAGAAVFQLRAPGSTPRPLSRSSIGPDYSLVGSALGLSRDPVALTDGDGSLLVVNAAYRERFGNTSAAAARRRDEEARAGLEACADRWLGATAPAASPGSQTSAGISSGRGRSRRRCAATCCFGGFPSPSAPDPLSAAVRRIEGPVGQRLAAAGVLAAVVDQRASIVAANSRSPNGRSRRRAQAHRKSRFADLVEVGEDEQHAAGG